MTHQQYNNRPNIEMSPQAYSPQGQYGWQPQQEQRFCQDPQLFIQPAFPILSMPQIRTTQVLQCQTCQLPVQSKVEYKYGKGAALFSVLTAKNLCCLIPCFWQDCKDAVHTCPRCNQEIGRKRFLFE